MFQKFNSWSRLSVIKLVYPFSPVSTESDSLRRKDLPFLQGAKLEPVLTMTYVETPDIYLKKTHHYVTKDNVVIYGTVSPFTV